ncbi:hypothetical protein COCOBI_18-1050 [Coccomyxa sp. Obi]|nr:hypothetical protein COCOBI_18-1050 [Coccomyxa sp. Obi]
MAGRPLSGAKRVGGKQEYMMSERGVHQAKIRSLTTANDDLTSRLTTAESDLSAAQNEVVRLRAQRDALRHTVTVLETQNDTLTTRLTAAEDNFIRAARRRHSCTAK